MDNIVTLHQFMLNTKNVIYILIVMGLVAFPAFWYFLNERDKD